MMNEKPWYEVVVIPALLRHARHTYGTTMRAELEKGGFGDIPGNGLYVVGALADSSAPFEQIVGELELAPHVAAKLVGALEMRGYVMPADDPTDRMQLTERGRRAAATMRTARERIDAKLAASVGEPAVNQMRKALAVLIAMKPPDGVLPGAAA